MKVNIDFAQYVAVIEFDPFLGEDIKEYQKEFEKWYFQRIRKMKYKPKKESEIFDAKLVVEWLKIASPNCRAKIVEPFLNIGEEDKSLPYMYF